MISEYFVRITAFRRLQNMLIRLSKNTVLDILIKCLSSRSLEIYEHM